MSDDNGSGPPQGMIPYPLFPMIQHQQVYRSGRAPTERYVPPRVDVAFRILEHMTAKTASTPLPLRLHSMDSVEFEEMKGQRLTDEEAAVQATACNILSSYLAGKLPLNDTEKQVMRKGRGRSKGPTRAIRINCFQCQNHMVGRASCHVCGGSGGVIVQYAREKRQ